MKDEGRKNGTKGSQKEGYRMAEGRMVEGRTKEVRT
jgi:hypothetical protein